jgi:hypothetical protein
LYIKKNFPENRFIFGTLINNKTMGRYYTGDIKGKFWFGVQDSDDASHFGGSEVEELDEETNDTIGLQYHFTTEDLQDINEGIQTCTKELGSNLDFLDKYFGPGGEGESGYQPDRLAKQLGAKDWTDKKYTSILEKYARLILGRKIKECVERTGKCSFEAEL